MRKLNKIVFCALVAICLLAPVLVVSAEEPSSSIQASLDAFVGVAYKVNGYRDNGGQWVTIAGVKPVVDNIRGYNCGGFILEAARELYGPIKLEDVIKRRPDSDTNSAWVTYGRDEILNIADLFGGRLFPLEGAEEGAGIPVSEVESINFRNDRVYLATFSRPEDSARTFHHVALIYQKTIWEAVNPEVQKVDLAAIAKRYLETEKIFLVELPLPSSQKSASEIYRFSLVRSDQKYTDNMLRVLNKIGNGQDKLIIPSNGKISFNDTIGCLAAECGYHSVFIPSKGWIPTAGACDVASFISYVAKQAGLNPVATDRDHGPVQGVPKEDLVVIWNPGKDLSVSNPLGHNVTIRWQVQDNILEMWSENGSQNKSSASKIRAAKGTNPVFDWEQPLAPMWQLSPTVLWWRDNIYKWAKIYRLNPNIAAAIMQIESCGHPETPSPANAQGLFQVMPDHFKGSDKSLMTDRQTNAKYGLSYYKEVLSLAKNDWKMALAAYNAGPGVLYRPYATWPAETQKYYYWAGMAEDAFLAKSDSVVLREWLAIGGSLCTRAAAWQEIHPQEASKGSLAIGRDDYGNMVVIDLKDISPVVVITVLLVVFWIIQKWIFRRIGRTAIVITTILVVVLWFPLPLLHLTRIQEYNKLEQYSNLPLEWKRKIEASKTAKAIDVIYEIGEIAQKVGIGLSEDVVEKINWAKETKDVGIEVLDWLSRDPVLTPIGMFLSKEIQLAVVEKTPLIDPSFLRSKDSFSPLFEPETKFLVREVKSEDGKYNPWGIHGDLCYSCTGLRSQLGTDIAVSTAITMSSPITGTIEMVVISDTSGSLIWIANQYTRFGLVGINPDDARKFTPGNLVKAGDPLGHRSAEFLHVIFERRNTNGTWGDYPITAVLLESLNIAELRWFETVPPRTNKYVPTSEELRQRSSILDLEMEVIEVPNK